MEERRQELNLSKQVFSADPTSPQLAFAFLSESSLEAEREEPVFRRLGGPARLGYAVLLLEHGVLCVLPMLWAALLFSEAGWDFWAGWTGAAATPPPPPPAEAEKEAESRHR